ncbi:hypothetical protein KCP71_13740 [Salmonella enterica subsp. enterica]|nr:hypothetical protein KCP71_13740 [Salmonella enterica subsp. enterica]
MKCRARISGRFLAWFRSLAKISLLLQKRKKDIQHLVLRQVALDRLFTHKSTLRFNRLLAFIACFNVVIYAALFTINAFG